MDKTHEQNLKRIHVFFISVPNVPKLIDTNIPFDYQEAMSISVKLWVIISLAPGVSLAEYMKDKLAIGLRSAIGFCIKLLHILESFHARGVVHRDLKPDNIHIDCPNNCLLEEGIITVLDFGLAYIKERQLEELDFDAIDTPKLNDQFVTDTGQPLGNRWYRVPQLASPKTTGDSEFQINQLIQQRRSPSIDVSYVCGILFWLLTLQVPGEEYAKKKEVAPHRKLVKEKSDIWEKVTREAVGESSEGLRAARRNQSQEILSV